MSETFRRLWIKATCNWFVIGLHCATRGHQWHTYRIFNVKATTCQWCGKCGGFQNVDVVVVSERQQVRRFKFGGPA
jgi:hypothetical protein